MLQVNQSHQSTDEQKNTIPTQLHPQGQTRIKAAAALIGVSPLTLRRWWTDDKFVKPTNINGILLFKNSDLLAFIESQHANSEV